MCSSALRLAFSSGVVSITLATAPLRTTMRLYAHQRENRIVGRDQDDLLLGDQEIERALAVDASIFDFVDEHDGRSGEKGCVRDHERAALAAAQLRHRHVGREGFTRQFVRASDHVADNGLAVLDHAAARMHRNELADGQIDYKIHVLRELRDKLAVGRIAPARIGRRAVNEHAAAGRRIALREAFDVGEQAALAGACRADDADDVARLQLKIEVLQDRHICCGRLSRSATARASAMRGAIFPLGQPAP